jgi:exodeoxyribonuclease VII large subunit
VVGTARWLARQAPPLPTAPRWPADRLVRSVPEIYGTVEPRSRSGQAPSRSTAVRNTGDPEVTTVVDHPLDDGVIWLYDPALDAEVHAPLTVGPGELFELLEDVLAESGIDEVVVTGTIQGVRRRPRWWSFDLVEVSATGDTPSATLRCVVFARQMSSIEAGLAAGASVLADGALATVTGALQTHAPWGQLRVVASAITVLDERSANVRARDRLVDRLVDSGDAAIQRRLVLPLCPRRIGLLAGDGTAGAADLGALLESSGHDWQLNRRSVPMAGPHAANAVVHGLAALAERDLDVIVVARGGGAPGDMAWADSETVARAIVICPVPVWTAIGHATDQTVADLVANRSCETPSAAAAALIGMVNQDIQRRRTAAAAAAQPLNSPKVPLVHAAPGSCARCSC